MIPSINFNINPLLIKYLYREKENYAGNKGISLLKFEDVYNGGVKGYFTKLIAESENQQQFEDKLNRFKVEFIETLRNDNIEGAKAYSFHADKLERLKGELIVFWENEGIQILESIDTIFGDVFKEAVIDVYLIPGDLQSNGKSNPLILPQESEDTWIVLQILVHELIHRHAAKAGPLSLYECFAQNAKIRNINPQESYNRILHPMFFYTAYYIIKSCRKENIKPFYYHKEYSSIKFFSNTIMMLENCFDKYYKKEISMDEFAACFFKSYVANPDRIINRW